MGICAAIPMSFGLITGFIGGTAAAAGVALVNSVGNLGGFAGPHIYGWLKDLTGSGNTGFYVILALCVLSGVLALVAKGWPAENGESTPQETAQQEANVIGT